MFFVTCHLQNKLGQILQHLLVLCLKPVKTTQSLFSFQSYVSGGGDRVAGGNTQTQSAVPLLVLVYSEMINNLHNAPAAEVTLQLQC